MPELISVTIIKRFSSWFQKPIFIRLWSPTNPLKLSTLSEAPRHDQTSRSSLMSRPKKILMRNWNKILKWHFISVFFFLSSRRLFRIFLSSPGEWGEHKKRKIKIKIDKYFYQFHFPILGFRAAEKGGGGGRLLWEKWYVVKCNRRRNLPSLSLFLELIWRGQVVCVTACLCVSWKNN